VTISRLSWIAVAYRSSRSLSVALASLRAEARRAGIDAEAVLVDHSEDAAELERLRALGAEAVLARPNRGYAAGLNAGRAAATGEVLLFSNPDVEFLPGSLSALLAALDRFPIAGPQFVLGQFLLPPAEEQTAWQEFRRLRAARTAAGRRVWLAGEAERARRVWEASTPVEVPTLSGALIATRREVADRVGAWNEEYFLYFEETEWLRRARRLGLRMAIAPEARVAHYWGHAADPRAPESAERYAASRALFYRRHYGVLGRWLARAGGASPADHAPLLPGTELQAPAQWWLLSPRAAGFPAAGAFVEGAALPAALDEARRLAPALREPWVTPWPAGRSPGTTFRAPAPLRRPSARRDRSKPRPARDADTEALVALFARRFDYAVTAEAWRWKYSARVGQILSAVVENDAGEIVAHAGALAQPARWSNGRGLLWQLVDYMGTPAGTGLFPPLVGAGNFLLRQLDGLDSAPFIFGFPSETAFSLGRRRFGYLPLRRVARLAGPLPETTNPAPGLVEWTDRAGDWAVRAWEACAATGVVRSQEFLDWRYTARPDRYYRFYRLRAGDCEGFAVFGFHGEDAVAAELWLPGEGDWQSALTAVAVDLRGIGMRTWSFWPPFGPHAESALASLGVQPTQDSIFIGLRAHGTEEAAYEAARDVYIGAGDFDMT
jgi:GT2 family glycosyltransferase